MAPRWRTTLGRAAASGLQSVLRRVPRTHPRRDRRRRPAYPGDFVGQATLEYDPRPDGRADPGEVVWAWVPFEEDATRGKDRPALVVAQDGPWVLALMLSSKDHVSAGRSPVRDHDPVWHDLGTGSWDRQGRPSEVRLDRVLRLDPDGVRREGGRLDRDRFDQVAARLRALYGWT